MEIICPRCKAPLEAGAGQTNMTAGAVRCGHCRQVFAGASGEITFVAPDLPTPNDDPLTNINVQPMAVAELPAAFAPASRVLWIAVGALALCLLAQLGWRHAASPAGSIEIDSLSVRPHVDYDAALRLDAALRNTGDSELPYPNLRVAFRNRHGEPEATGVFTPQNYLRGELPGTGRFPANTRIPVSLILNDPGPQAVNYSLQLHYVNQRQH